MELQTRLVFIDTSAYEQKKLQFGHFALDRLERMVTEKKIHLLITDVVRSEIESHLKKFAHDAVTEHKKFRKLGSFLCVADEVTGGGLFPDITAEAVLREATRKFHALVDNGYTESVSVEAVSPKQIFDDYFSNAPPFHRDAKKSEFPDAFSLAAVDILARSRMHKVYIVSGDGDMAAVADVNDNFLFLPGIDALLDLVNRNDEELADLSVFADTVFELLREDILARGRDLLKDSEFIGTSEYDGEYETDEVEVDRLNIADTQLIEVTDESAFYDVLFDAVLTVSYDYTNYSSAVWDREDRVYYNVSEDNITYRHQLQLGASLEIGFSDSLKINAEIISFTFDESLFELDIDEAEYIGRTGVDDEPQEFDQF